MKVYAAINAVQAALAKEGISKDRRNQAQGYNFRGIDDMYNALAPLLSANGLCILPRVMARTMQERQSVKGGVLIYVTVDMEFDFVAAEDGSKHVVRMFGEAMDSGDKATNKAMSAAYKYACMQTFSIPTEADNDADAHSPQVAAVIVPKEPPKLQVPPCETKDYILTAERAEELYDAAACCIDKFRQNDKEGAYDEISGITSNGEKLFLWAVLKEFSAVRAYIKSRWQNGQTTPAEATA